MDKDEKNTAQHDLAASYNQFKEFEGQPYTGMKIGRSHSWVYDQGQWKETKLTPDKWEISYAVTKRRKGRAPEGSGVPVGTKYHWYILAHQTVEKLNANDYSTEMIGLKYKLAHQRADKEDWNISEKAQKKRLIKILKELLATLEEQVAMERKKKTKKSSAEIAHFPKKIAAKEVAIEHKHRKRVAHR